jgi:hypothetical protein
MKPVVIGASSAGPSCVTVPATTGAIRSKIALDMAASNSLLDFSGRIVWRTGAVVRDCRSRHCLVHLLLVETFWHPWFPTDSRMLGAQLFNATLNFLRSFRKNCRLIRGFNDHLAAAHELNRAVARGQVQFECRLVPKEGRIELRLETDLQISPHKHVSLHCLIS